MTADAVRELIHLTYQSQFGLTDAQFRIIGRLKNIGPCTQQEISEMTSMDKMTVSRAARGLVQRGAVCRRAHSEDGRAHLLNITDEGVALSLQIEKRAAQLETALLETWTEEEIGRFKSDLDRLTDLANQQIQLVKASFKADPDVPKVRRRR